MKFFHFISLIFVLTISSGFTFLENSPIKAEDLNNKFNSIKETLQTDKNTYIEFNQFESGDLITKEIINAELEKILGLNLTVKLLESKEIKSSEFNAIFSAIELEIMNANHIPLISSENIQTIINQTYQGSLIIQDTDDTSFSFIISTQPTKGNINFLPNGEFTYVPHLNTYGMDSFSVIANDGKSNSNEITINIIIQGEGIILSNGIRTYFDGSHAISCREYRFQNENNFNYTGSTGSGIYLIQPSTESSPMSAYCDMTTDGGGWTQVMRQHNTTMEFNTTGALRLENLHLRNHNSKYADTLIRELARSGQREALIEYNTSNKYIIRYSDAEWSNFSSTGFTNIAYDTKASNGVWTANRCNGHFNNRGFSTYSDSAKATCPGIFQGNRFYFFGYHTTGSNNSANNLTNVLVR